jgi:hypothetical protein
MSVHVNFHIHFDVSLFFSYGPLAEKNARVEFLWEISVLVGCSGRSKLGKNCLCCSVDRQHNFCSPFFP